MHSQPSPFPGNAGNQRAVAVIPAIRNILVIVDPTADAQPAIDKAAKIAATLGSSLELYVCDAEPTPADNAAVSTDCAEFREARRRGFMDSLEGYAAPLRLHGLHVTIQCEWHAPLAQGIGYHVLRTRPDLVVKDTHRHPAPARDDHAPTDWDLIAQLSAPLLLVRPQPWSGRPAIAVSVDPCHAADRPESLDQMLVSLGCLFANGLGGQLEAWHVLEQPPHLPGEPAAPLEIARASGAARDTVDRVVNVANNMPTAIPTFFLEGAVAIAIAARAEERRPDVLMLGAAARPRWAHSAASGTAAQLLEQIPCDLLVMKPEGFVSPLLVHEA
jgi:universal stress protein E